MTPNMHDSGQRQEFSTGAVRDAAAGKSQLGLISPIWLLQLSAPPARNARGRPRKNQQHPWAYIQLWRHERQGRDQANRLVLAAWGTMLLIDPTWTRRDMPSPLAMRRLAAWLEVGAQKYTARNWEKGIPLSRTLDSLMRHVLAVAEGRDDEDHLAAILCNLMFLTHTETMIARGLLPKELDDLPRYV